MGARGAHVRDAGRPAAVRSRQRGRPVREHHERRRAVPGVAEPGGGERAGAGWLLVLGILNAFHEFVRAGCRPAIEFGILKISCKKNWSFERSSEKVLVQFENSGIKNLDFRTNQLLNSFSLKIILTVQV